MSTYDSRLAALEEEAMIMKQDIIYKLDDTNSAVTIIKGVVGSQGRDVKFLINQVKSLDFRLNGLEIQLEGLTQEVRTIKGQQDVQGKDIKDVKRRLDGIDQRLASFDQRFGGIDQRFGGIDQRFDGIDQRFDSIDQRFTSLEEKFDQRFEQFDQRFEQVLQVLATLTTKGG